MDVHADIPGDAAEEDRRQIAASVNRHGRRAAVRMAEPLVGTALTNLSEPSPARMAITSRGLRTGTGGMPAQATTTVWVPTGSEWSASGLQHDHIDHTVDDLTGWVAQIAGLSD